MVDASRGLAHTARNVTEPAVQSERASRPTAGHVRIEALRRSRRDVLRFLKVGYTIYQNDPYWVAPLLSDLAKVFLDTNPFLRHADMALWVATRHGRDVGRIAAIVDHNYNDFHNERTAFFGFFECVEDGDISTRLFQTAFDWARRQGQERIIGPMNPSTNDECGLLVDGFDASPVFMMTYNPRYYPALVEAAGFRKAKDLLAFHIDLANCPLDRLARIAAKAQSWDEDIRIRPVRRKTLDADLARIKEVYNSAWERNWGFVPMTDEEIDFMAARLRPLFCEGLVWLAEHQNDPVGFLLAMPDYNVALKPLRGRLLTPRLLTALPYLLQWKYPPLARVLTLGVKEGFRGKGLESAMLIEGLKVGFKMGFREAEASWILEDNLMMRRVLQVFRADPYKTYRLYEREL